MNKKVVLWALILIVLAIIFGAFGAHALENALNPKQLASFKTGANYQLIGGIILLVFGLNQNKFVGSINKAISLFFVGVCLFSFSIYFLCLFPFFKLTKYFALITPIGGLSMILALLIVIYTVIKQPK